MGAGNPLARSYDNSLYDPTTYYIDFTECYSDGKEETIKEECKQTDRDFYEMTEEEINQSFYFLLENDLENFKESLLQEPFGYHSPDDTHDDD